MKKVLLIVVLLLLLTGVIAGSAAAKPPPFSGTVQSATFRNLNHWGYRYATAQWDVWQLCDAQAEHLAMIDARGRSVAYVYQDVYPSDGGEQVYWAARVCPGSGPGFMRVEYYNGNQLVKTYTRSLYGAWPFIYRLDHVTPTNATKARVVLFATRDNLLVVDWVNGTPLPLPG